MHNETPVPTASPAIAAAQEAEASIKASIAEGKSFLLEAGAGAGKTYSLIAALKDLISTRGAEFIRQGQHIACITFTNVASDTIQSRIDKHPVVVASTIHAFCWSLIKNFQPQLRQIIPTLPEWTEKLAEAGEAIGTRRVDYELGYRGIETDFIRLGHTDVITLTVALMKNPKFCDFFTARFPILFIDEYQDTNEAFSEAIKTHFLSTGKGPLVGFFGDHWQKIYNDGGGISHAALRLIKKGANFRSVPAIVDCLNRIRPDLTQAVRDPAAPGSVTVYHTNAWASERQTAKHWKGDLPLDDAHKALGKVKTILASAGWNFADGSTKILMLTHSNLAKEQGYESFATVFDRADSYIRKEDAHISFLADTVEPLSIAYEKKRYGEMFAVLDTRTPAIRKHSDKQEWADALDELMRLRRSGTIGEVIDHLKKTKRPRLPEKIEKKEDELTKYSAQAGAATDEKMERLKRLRAIPYKELTALDQFIDERTPFSTKHGVKGEEFENVLVVIGRGWDNYNFGNMLEWKKNGVPAGKNTAYERNRNLFYVACSRPKKRLALLFTQSLSEAAMATLIEWFGTPAIKALDQV